MKAITLFAGAGGADVGMAQAGVEHVRCIEYDEHAAATLGAAGFPAVHGDVRDLSLYEGLGHIDLMWASPPCQDWSAAGKREGASGERNGWPWTWDAIDALRANGSGIDWLVAENVPGMLAHNGKACGSGCCADPLLCARTYFLEVVMAEARKRFAWAEWRVLDAASYGVPQFRKRVILVAGPRPIQWPKPTHGEPSAQVGMFGSLKPWVTVRDALGLGGRAAWGSSDNTNAKHPAHETDQPIASVGTKGNGHVIGSGLKGSEWTADRPSPVVRDGNGTAGVWIRTEATGAVAHPDTTPIATVSSGGNQYVHETDPGARPQRGGSSGCRRLTVKECARLQDFPGDHPWQGTKTAIYRQIGNAVPPTLARVVARAVTEAGLEDA